VVEIFAPVAEVLRIMLVLYFHVVSVSWAFSEKVMPSIAAIPANAGPIFL
jgi:hypothetical protein